MELKLQLTSETKNTEQLSLTQNPMTHKLSSALLEKFDTVYEGTKACKLTDIAEHDALTAELTRLEVTYKTKILRKPSTVYYVLLVDNLWVCGVYVDKLRNFLFSGFGLK